MLKKSEMAALDSGSGLVLKERARLSVASWVILKAILLGAGVWFGVVFVMKFMIGSISRREAFLFLGPMTLIVLWVAYLLVKYKGPYEPDAVPEIAASRSITSSNAEN